ncbi:MAG: phospholipase [Nitrospiraceae bacterium]|nr:phospholipase [Nitrospiraceae bacterium]
MTKRTRQRTRTVLLLLLIAAIAVGAAMAHYALRGGEIPFVKNVPRGNLGGVKERIAGLAGKAKEMVGQLPLPTLGDKTSPLKRDAGQAEAEEAAATEVAVVDERGDIRVYFAPCAPVHPFGIDDALFKMLKGATRSIHAAFFELQLNAAADLLIGQHERGLEVQLVSDSNYEDRPAIQACIRAGIPVVFDERSAFMHNKFCVVDGESVWTGSTNITKNGMYRNDNNAVLIRSRHLAENFTSEFAEMFGQRKFGRRSPRKTRYPRLTVGDVPVECYFAPEDNVRSEIIDEIRDANDTIDFMAFAFTSEDIAKAMAARIKDGVRVRGLFEARQAGSKYSRDDFLAKRGARIQEDHNAYTMHNKVIIVDDETVITGSYNFSQSAETKNDENVVIIHSPSIAKRYRKQFESLLN